MGMEKRLLRGLRVVKKRSKGMTTELRPEE